MIDDQDTLVAACDDLAEARVRIDAAREALRQAPDVDAGDVAPVRQARARLERITAEVARIEVECAGQTVGGRR